VPIEVFVALDTGASQLPTPVNDECAIADGGGRDGHDLMIDTGRDGL